MSGTGARWRRAAGRLRATAVVMAIVAASVIGLHDWADGVATHEVVSAHGVSQDAPAG